MAVWRSVIDLMLLRAGPQDMPGDRVSVAVTALLYGVAGVAQVALLEATSQAVLLAALTTLLLAIYAAALLAMRGYPNRFRQTAVALFATGTLFTVLMLGPDYAIAPYLRSLRQPPVTQQVDGGATGQAANDQNPDASGANAGRSGARNAQPSGNGVQSASGGRVPTPSPLVFLAFVIAGVWRLIVYAHIFRSALEVSRWLGLAASFGFEVFLIIVFSVI